MDRIANLAMDAAGKDRMIEKLEKQFSRIIKMGMLFCSKVMYDINRIRIYKLYVILLKDPERL